MREREGSGEWKEKERGINKERGRSGEECVRERVGVAEGERERGAWEWQVKSERECDIAH